MKTPKPIAEGTRRVVSVAYINAPTKQEEERIIRQQEEYGWLYKGKHPKTDKLTFYLIA